MKIKEILIKILVFIAENITCLLTILVGTYLFFHYSQLTIEQLLQYIIGGISLIAGSMLIEKVSLLEKIKKTLSVIAQNVKKESIFTNCQSSGFWKEALTSGKSIFMSGGSLFFVFSTNPGDFETLLKNGCKVEVVVMDPNSIATEILYNDVIKEVASLDAFKTNIRQTIAYLGQYKEKYPNQIIIRLDNHVPAFGIMAVYHNDRPKKIQVNLFSERVSYDRRLSFIVYEDGLENEFAYNYLCDQIERLKKRLPTCTIEEIKKIESDIK